MNNYKIMILVILFALMIFGYLSPVSVFSQPEAGQEDISSAEEEFNYFMAPDYIDVNVKVASLFQEDDLVVGSSVSKITPDMWRKIGAKKMTDALETQTAMVSYPALFGFNTTAIRGYSRDGIATKGVVTLVDGIPVIELVNGTNDGMPNVGLGSLRNIEIIKGPGSAIYGSDAFHGVISLNTFESDNDVYEVEAAGAYPLYGEGSLRISQGLGEFFRINTSASYGGQFASEDLEYDYDTKEKPAGSYMNPIYQPAAKGTGEYENRYRSATGVLKLDIKPADKLKLNLGGYVVNNKCYDFSGVKEIYLLQLNQYDHTSQDSTIFIYSGSIEYLFNNKISVEARGYYWYWNMLFTSANGWNGEYYTFNVDEGRTGADFIIKQAENRLNLQWLLAYSRSYSRIIKKVGRAYDEYGSLYSPKTGSSEDSYKIYPDEGMNRTIDSGYTQVKWGLIKERLFLLLGGRLDHYSDWGNQSTPRGGIILLPTEDSSVKALYGRAFRAPSGNDLYGIENYVRGNLDLKPEIIDIYELIYIYKGKDWRVTLNGFYSNWRNGIIIEPLSLSEMITTGYAAMFSNSGNNRAYGGELNLFYPMDPFALELGGSYVKSTALDFKPTTLNPIEAKVRDYDYKTFPEFIIIAGLHYAVKQIGVDCYLKNRVYLNMMETSQTDEKDKLPAYWRADLNISKHVMEKLDLYLDIKNLTNRKNYLPSLYTSMLSEEDGIPEAGISVLFRAGYRI